MKRVVVVFGLVALALSLPAVAAAKKGSADGGRASKVYKGAFRAVGADGAYSPRRFGKAQLVDGKKRDKLSVHVRKLARRTTYVFALYQVEKGQPVCDEDAGGGTRVEAFARKAKRSNAAGNFNANLRSKTFKADRGLSYFVLVSATNPDGSPADAVACAALKGKGKKAKEKDKSSGDRGKDKAKGGHGKGPKH
jgi:hypothetical protein